MKCIKSIMPILILMLIMSSCGSGSDGGTEMPKELSSGEKFISYVVKANDQYTSAHSDVDVIKFSQRSSIAKFMTKVIDGTFNDECDYISEDYKLFDGMRYKRSSDGCYLFLGEFKDNYPDGVGLIVQVDSALGYCLADHYKDGVAGALDLFDIEDMGNSISGMVYLGNFDEGRFSGYGMQFEGVEGQWFELYFGEEASSEEVPEGSLKEIDNWYAFNQSFLVYEGEFEDSEREGKGNCYIPPTVNEIRTILQASGMDLRKEMLILTGKFHKDEAEGDIKEFWQGNLRYDGEYKDGNRHGEGKAYFPTGQLQYKGEFKKGQYHGEGTLYDENGDEVYSGDWAYGEYN